MTYKAIMYMNIKEKPFIKSAVMYIHVYAMTKYDDNEVCTNFVLLRFIYPMVGMYKCIL